MTTLATEPITDLLKEIETFEPEIFPPVAEVCSEHCAVLGDCPPELRRFYSFSRHCERELMQLRVELQFSADEDEALELRIGQLSKKQEVTRAMLFYALREHFHAYEDGKSMDLAKGWKVVSFERGPDLPPQIRALFGLGGPR